MIDGDRNFLAYIARYLRGCPGGSGAEATSAPPPVLAVRETFSFTMKRVGDGLL